MEFPLLKRELSMLGERRQTYVVRTIACAAICGMFLYNHFDAYEHISATQFLGSGHQRLHGVVYLLFVMYLLLIPPLMISGFAEELEDRTLDLLLVSPMSSPSIVWQKFLGRMAPGYTLLLVMLPLDAIAYSYGGVQRSELVYKFFIFLMMISSIGMISMAAALLYGRTDKALLYGYVLGPVLVGWGGAASLMDLAEMDAWTFILGMLGAVTLCIFFFVLAWGHVRAVDRRYMQENLVSVETPRKEQRKVEMDHHRGKLFSWVENPYEPTTVRACWAVSLFAGPIAILLAVWVEPVLYFSGAVLVCLVAYTTASDPYRMVTSTFREREGQTLTLLLTTPMSSQEILEHKVLGIYEMFLRMFPFALCALASLVVAGFKPGGYLLRASGAAVAFLVLWVCWHHLLVWLGLWIGYRSAHRTRAILVTTGLTASLLFCFVYFPIPDVLNVFWVIGRLWSYPSNPELGAGLAFLHVALVASAYFGLRTWSLHRVDHLLGRGTDPSAS